MKNCLLIFFIGYVLLLSSCASKKVVYVQDMLVDTAYNAIKAPALRIQKSDRLSIVVSAKIPELAVPFNQGIGTYQVNEQGNVSNNPSTTPDVKGYLVDDNGEIEFPILGTLQVSDLTFEQVQNLVKSRLIDEKLINKPTVKVELLNLKINMMGEVNSVGVLEVPDGRITLLQAITMAGGLTVNAAPDRISVIREENGVRRKVFNNIQSRDIFNSPTYYLQQNDMVYVEPKDAVQTPKEEKNWRYISTGVGLLAVVFTLLNFFK